VPEHELSAAAATMRMVGYANGETLVREGAVGDDCFFIVSGEVRVSARSLIGSSVLLATLGPGALIGEIALLSSERRTATVRATGAVEALRLVREAAGRLPHPVRCFMKACQVKLGAVIVREGDLADAFYTIGSGSFEVRTGGKRVAVLK
jgi:CRP-like cAMP-binding protein